MTGWPAISRVLLAASAAIVFAALAVMAAAVPEQGGRTPVGHDLVRFSFWLSVLAFLFLVAAVSIRAYRTGDNEDLET